jgi:hypothetical protein
MGGGGVNRNIKADRAFGLDGRNSGKFSFENSSFKHFKVFLKKENLI